MKDISANNCIQRKAKKVPKKMSKSNDVIEFKWPWTMLPLEIADEWIEEVKKGLLPEEPIYGKEIFVSGRREDKKLLLVANDTDGSYAIVNYEINKLRRRLKCTVIETLNTRKELSNRLKQDHIEAKNNDIEHG